MVCAYAYQLAALPGFSGGDRGYQGMAAKGVRARQFKRAACHDNGCIGLPSLVTQVYWP